MIDPLGAHKKGHPGGPGESEEDAYEKKKREDELKRKRNMPHLKCRSNKLAGATLEESYIVSGDFMELRQNDDAVQFIVKYTPQSELHRSDESFQGVDFDGESVLMDELVGICHCYVPSPAETNEAVVVPGSVSITNYQLVFRASKVVTFFKQQQQQHHHHIRILFFVEKRII